jgi:hypothetical protein
MTNYRPGDLVLARVTTQPRRTSLDVPIADWKHAGPGVFNQGETLDELEQNIRNAYLAMTPDGPRWGAQTKEVELEI